MLPLIFGFSDSCFYFAALLLFQLDVSRIVFERVALLYIRFMVVVI
jgi:hypothetical protein